MNIEAKKIARNFGYTVSSNLVSLIVSAFVILIIPKVIGVTEYGYWQLYLFYSSYVGFLHFGWNDGIYLRYGGEEYELLDKKIFFSQYYIMLLIQILLGSILIYFSVFNYIGNDRSFILFMTAICMIIVNVRYMLLYILQATNRIKTYAIIAMVDKIIYIMIAISFVVFGIKDYKILIFADIFGKGISLLIAMFYCKDIVIGKFSSFYFPYEEIKKNISAGSKLMIANIASVLIIGVVRIGIERNWDVATFGKVSLSLSISNLLMTFINTIGIIIFPILRKFDKLKLSSIYTIIRNILMPILLGFLILFFPIKYLLFFWLPQYGESLNYMGLIFPICIFEGKMALLINTYLKTLRKEKMMLKINVTTVVLSVFFTIVSTAIFRNLNLAVISILILLIFRCVLSELYISKLLKVTIIKDILLEIMLSVIFIISIWYFNVISAFLIYLVLYIIYLLYKMKDIMKSLILLKKIVSKR